MAQSFVKCEICDERECAMICLDCDQYFCQKCKEGHIKTKTTKHHQFLDSGTFQPQFKKLRCTQHEHHFIFFCERCQTLVCPICLPENHQEHRMLKIDKVASIKKKELNETLKIFVTKLNEFESEVNSIQSITEKCKGENKYVIQHVDEQAKHISNVIENQRRCIIESVKQKAKTEEKRISILLEDLQHCMKEAKELERKVKLDIQGSETSLLSNFQLRKSKLDTFEFNDTTISTCPVQFAKYNVPKEELSLLESVFSSNLCGLSEHEESSLRYSSVGSVHLKILKMYLLQQKYPLKLIDDSIERTNKMSTNQLRTPKEHTTDDDILPFVTTHDPSLPNAFKFIKSNFPILHQSETMKNLVTEESIIYSRRQPKNLKRQLTKARFDIVKKISSVQICGDSRCGVCSRDNYIYLEIGSTKYFKNGKKFTVNANMTCKSENVIYCITCVNCKENYIGQTGNSVCERVRIHKQQIRQPEYRQIPLSEHLDICAGGKFKFFPFFKCTEPTEEYRKELERKFIKVFDAKLNA